MRPTFRNKRSYRCSIQSEWPCSSGCCPVVLCFLYVSCAVRDVQRNEKDQREVCIVVCTLYVQHLNMYISHSVVLDFCSALPSILPLQKQSQLLVANGADMRYLRAQLYAHVVMFSLRTHITGTCMSFSVCVIHVCVCVSCSEIPLLRGMWRLTFLKN